MQDFFSTMIAALETAGEIHLKYLGSLDEIRYKDKHNPVTRADEESEKAIIDTIRKKFPNHSFLAEESGGHSIDKSGYLWIIDPLDGTVNFSHSFPIFGPSVALMIDGAIEMGGVYNPCYKEMFYATKGKGAFFNKKPIRVSKIETLDDAVFVTGFPYDRHKRAHHYCVILEEFLHRAQGVRRVGAASLDLCSIACGRLDGFWEEKLNPWDTAGGWIILEEAGGKVTDFSGNEYNIFLPQIVATNGKIHNEVVQILKKYTDEIYDKETKT